MNKTVIFSLLGCFLFLIASCSDSNQSAKEEPQKKIATSTQAEKTPVKKKSNCKLTMGWDPWEPYQYLTVDDTVSGLEIELVSAIAKEADCELTFEQKSWMKLLNGIRSGTIDMLGGASKTEARETFAHFSDDYRHESFVLYVRSGEEKKFANKSLKEILEGDFKLGVTEDYIYGKEVSSLQDLPTLKAKFVSVPTSEVNYYNLVQNHIDGFLEDPFVAGYTIKRKGLQDEIMKLPIVIHSGDVALMFSKKSVQQETVEAFNQALKRLKASGVYDKILEKYSF